MGSETLYYKVSPNEDVRDLSGGDCDALIWLIVWCVWVCDESHIGYLLGIFLNIIMSDFFFERIIMSDLL